MSRRPPTTQPRTIALALALFALWAPATVVGSAGTTDLARKAIAEGRLEEARRMLEGRSEGTADDERLELLTQVCTALGDHEAGVRHGKEAVEASPTSSNAHFQYAVALPTKMQRVSRGKAMFLIGTETYKPIRIIDQLLAFHLRRREQFREADVEFQLLGAAEDPRVATGALYQRARNRILGRYEPDEATRFLEQFLQRVTDDLPGQPSRSHAYCRPGTAHEQPNRTAQPGPTPGRWNWILTTRMRRRP